MYICQSQSPNSSHHPYQKKNSLNKTQHASLTSWLFTPSMTSSSVFSCSSHCCLLLLHGSISHFSPTSPYSNFPLSSEKPRLLQWMFLPSSNFIETWVFTENTISSTALCDGGCSFFYTPCIWRSLISSLYSIYASESPVCHLP